MIIKRDDDVDEIGFTLRMLDVPCDVYESLVRRLENNFIFSIYKKGSGFNILIDIENIDTPDNIINLINDFSFLEVDIFIGITSSYDHGGVTVPENVLEIIKKMKGDLNFSYVNC